MKIYEIMVTVNQLVGGSNPPRGAISARQSNKAGVLNFESDSIREPRSSASYQK